MSRFMLVAASFFFAIGTASADYILIKINLNQMEFFPSDNKTGGAIGVPPKQAAGAGGIIPGGAGGALGAGGIPGGAIGVPPGGRVGGLPGGAIGVPPGGRMGGMPGGRIGGMPGGRIGGMPGGMMGGMPPGGMSGMPGGAIGKLPPGGAIGKLPPGGATGVPPGGMMGGQPPAIDPNNPPTMPEDPDAKWVYVYVEVKNLSQKPSTTPYGYVFTCDTKWAKASWLPYSPLFPWISFPLPIASFSKEYDAAMSKEKTSKEKNIENYLKIARVALSHSRHAEFHKAMAEAEKINDKHPVVKNYQRVKKELAKPLTTEDPLQRDVISHLKEQKYKENFSKNLQKKEANGHYCLYIPKDSDPQIEAAATRRLVMMEETMEAFYYWFAMHKENTAQPSLPKHRMIAVIPGSNEAFRTYHLKWGSPTMVADGFTPRRDNVMVLTAKPRYNDPLQAEFEKTLRSKVDSVIQQIEKVYGVRLTREEFLSLKAQDVKGAGQAAIFVAFAQTAVIAAKALEDEAERHTISNEGVRQLLVASNIFPRNVNVPDWMVEGIAAFFETPAGGVYPTVGERSWTHLISYKHFRTKYKEKFDVSHDILKNIVTDAYFADAKQKSKLALADRSNKDAQKAAKDSWELARCTSWSFIYYLASTGKLSYLVNYGKELEKLPRDIDLNDSIMQGCFAKAFDMADTRDARQLDSIKLKNLATAWQEKLDETNIEPATLQSALLELRAAQDGATTNPTPPGKGGNPGGGGINPRPPQVQPQPPVVQPPVNQPQPQPQPVVRPPVVQPRPGIGGVAPPVIR